MYFNGWVYIYIYTLLYSLLDAVSYAPRAAPSAPTLPWVPRNGCTNDPGSFVDIHEEKDRVFRADIVPAVANNLVFSLTERLTG